MRIAILNFAREFGGGEQWTLATAQGLQEHEHSLLILGRRESTYMERARDAGLTFMAAPAGPDYNPVSIGYLLRLFLYFKPDVLIVSHSKDVRTGGVAASILGIPVLHRNGFPILLNTKRHRLTYGLTDRILTNSQRIRDHYVGSLPWIDADRIDVVPNGAHIPLEIKNKQELRRELGLPANRLIALFAGRLTVVKRVFDLLAALDELTDNSRWDVAVMGDGPERETLALQRESLAHPERVHLLGYHPDAPDKLPLADLVVLPSKEEGMPNTLMEAMARRVPVAATPVGDVPYLLDNGAAGWMFPVGQPQTIASLLVTLEHSPDSLAHMAQQGFRHIAANYTFDSMLDGVEKACRACIQTAKRTHTES